MRAGPTICYVTAALAKSGDAFWQLLQLRRPYTAARPVSSLSGHAKTPVEAPLDLTADDVAEPQA